MEGSSHISLPSKALGRNWPLSIRKEALPSHTLASPQTALGLSLWYDGGYPQSPHLWTFAKYVIKDSISVSAHTSQLISFSHIIVGSSNSHIERAVDPLGLAVLFYIKKQYE